MENPVAFFRVFDTAFFIPGALVVGTAWHAWGLAAPFRGNAEQGTVDAVALGVWMLAVVYAVGVAVHAIGRFIFTWARADPPCGERRSAKGRGIRCLRYISGRRASRVGSPWYAKLEKGRREALAEYFWYTRATCHNLAVAVPVATALTLIPPSTARTDMSQGLAWLVTFVGAFLCYFFFMRQCFEYDEAIQPAVGEGG